MRYFALFVLLVFSLAALAQQQTDTEQASPFPVETPYSGPGTDNAYISAVLGNGVAYGGNTVAADRTMHWRTFELRFGKEIAAPDLVSGSSSPTDATFRADFVHFNEGHPKNNHRDGFGVQLVFDKPLSDGFDLELGFGPYYSMNTTTINDVEINDAKLGALLSVATRMDLDRFSPGLHMRYALNHVTMPGAHYSVALLVGVGKYFDRVPERSQSRSSGEPYWLGVSGGTAQTNHGIAEEAMVFSVEAKKHYSSHWAASLSGILGEDDGSRVHRSGIALQGWFVQSLDEDWAASAGLGPYLAANKRDGDNYHLHGLITLQVERFIGDRWKGLISFSRVATFKERNDRDLFRLGVMREFGA
jgi:hypothetical protein